MYGDVKLEGDTNEDSEELELWLHDPVACIQELIGNPAFKENILYSLEKVYADCQGRIWWYDEMWTGDWWWNIQVCQYSDLVVTHTS